MSSLLMILLLITSSLELCLCVKCPVSPQDSAIRRLRSFLLCDYDAEERPVKDVKQPVDVKISLDLKHVFMIDATKKCEIHAWVTSIWKDSFLEWEPDQYEGIERIQIDNSHIWVPEVSIFNSDLTQIQVFSSTRCVLHPDGMVMCAPHLRTPVYCQQMLKRWPFDTQRCTLVLGTWGLLDTEVNIDLLGQGWSTYDGVFEANNAWALLEVTAKHMREDHFENKTYSHLNYNFTLRRHDTLQASIVIAPAFALAGLALSSFWVTGIMCRASICCVSLIGDALFIQYIGYHLPTDGDTSPDIVAYYRDAMFLSLISLVLLIIVERFRNSKSIGLAPEWVTRVATWLRGPGGKTGQFLLGDVEQEEQVIKQVPDVEGVAVPSVSLPDWSCYGNFLERISFVAMFITHAVMLAALLP